jgi:homoserine dehydrogenase
MAKSRKLNFMFEASVGGGIPIIRPLNQSLTADEITQITGILNGTTNYILTKMSRDGSSYEDVLKEAQELGYAERNPEADVEGYDACRKIAILTSLAFGSTVKFEEIYTEGITKISTADFKYAEKLGCVVKLLATSFKKDGKVYAITAPFMIDRTHPLYNVNDVLNGVYVNGNIVGDVMFFGAGAGKLPTASAVVADVVDSVKHKGKNVMTIWSQEKLSLGNAEDVERSFFVRIKGGDEVLEKAKESFNAVRIVNADGVTGEFGLVTHEMTEKAFADIAKDFEVVNRIRFDMTTLNV